MQIGGKVEGLRRQLRYRRRGQLLAQNERGSVTSARARLALRFCPPESWSDSARPRPNCRRAISRSSATAAPASRQRTRVRTRVAGQSGAPARKRRSASRTRSRWAQLVAHALGGAARQLRAVEQYLTARAGKSPAMTLRAHSWRSTMMRSASRSTTGRSRDSLDWRRAALPDRF